MTINISIVKGSVGIYTQIENNRNCLFFPSRRDCLPSVGRQDLLPGQEGSDSLRRGPADPLVHLQYRNRQRHHALHTVITRPKILFFKCPIKYFGNDTFDRNGHFSMLNGFLGNAFFCKIVSSLIRMHLLGRKTRLSNFRSNQFALSRGRK